MSISKRWKIRVAFAVIYIGWGSSYLAARFTIRVIPPLLSSGVGFVVAGLLLFGWSLRREAWPARRAWTWAALIGLFMIVGGMGGTIWSQQRIASGLAALVVSAEPVWMALYEWVFEKRRPRWPVVLGLCLGVGGLLFLAFGDSGQIDRTGLLVLSLAAPLWVVGALLSRKARTKESETQSTGLDLLIGGIELLLLSAALGEWGRFHLSHLTWLAGLSWCYNTFFSSLVGFTAYLWLLKVERVSVVATYAFVNPVVALFLGWAFAHETLNWRSALASVLLIGGVSAITLYRMKENAAN